MKILHIDMSGPFTEHMTYQENLLPEAMAKDGHDVVLCVPNYEWKGGKIVETPVEKKVMDNGVELRRYAFKRPFGSEWLSKKIRFVPNFYKEIEEIDPDIIMQHCPQTKTALTVCKYIKDHPKVKLVTDTHTDYYNSANSFLSRYLLHRILYKHYVQSVSKYASEMYYLTLSTRDFYVNEYSIPEDKMEFLPLGGIIPDNEVYNENYRRVRDELSISDNQILFLHSGKITEEKKTDILAEAFLESGCDNALLVILGVMDSEMESRVKPYISSSEGKIRFLGWKNSEELNQYLCAADVYAQPGSQSATFQNSICSSCAVIVYPHESYKQRYVDGNGLWAKDKEELIKAIREVCSDTDKLEKMKGRSKEIAIDILDYKMQGRRIIADCQENYSERLK